jgi:hypothetical protein
MKNFSMKSLMDKGKNAAPGSVFQIGHNQL